MKARVDIEIYERWIAEFKGFSSGNFGYRQVDSICEKSEIDLINQIRSYLKTHKKLFLEMIVKERRVKFKICLLYTSPSPRDRTRSRMPSSA